MCNDFGNRVPYDDYLGAFSQIAAPVRFPTDKLRAGNGRNSSLRSVRGSCRRSSPSRNSASNRKKTRAAWLPGSLAFWMMSMT